jgi:hypothetical protein
LTFRVSLARRKLSHCLSSTRIIQARIKITIKPCVFLDTTIDITLPTINNSSIHQESNIRSVRRAATDPLDILKTCASQSIATPKTFLCPSSKHSETLRHPGHPSESRIISSSPCRDTARLFSIPINCPQSINTVYRADSNLALCFRWSEVDLIRLKA